MDEAEFRDRVRSAFGEAPDERAATQRAAAVLHRSPSREERTGPPRAMALVAGALAVLVLAGLLGPRLLRAAPRSDGPAAGGAAPTPSPSVSDLATCRIPVVVNDFHNTYATPAHPPPHFTAGFVSPATGRFVGDPTAQGGSMPFGRSSVNDGWSAESYDPVLKRWLSARRNQISPDGRSYVYVALHPLATDDKGGQLSSSTLSVYDVATGRNRDLWTSADDIDTGSTWQADGIHTYTIPRTGGRATYWIVNPVTGAVAADPVTPAWPVGPASFSSWGVGEGGTYGIDGAGRPVLLDGSRDPGTHQEYFVGAPNGRRIVIHDGTMGDAFDFDPGDFVADGDRLWAANYDATALWLWTEKDGLKRIALSGIVQRDGLIIPAVVGPCG